MAIDEGQSARIRLGRAATLAQLGDHVRAVQEADTLTGPKLTSRDALYDAVRVYALSSTAAGQDQGLAEADRPARAEQYTERALAVLRRALDAGYNNIQKLKEDAALAPLRSRPEFKGWLAGLEKNAAKQGK
jgi:hypothetical protein